MKPSTGVWRLASLSYRSYILPKTDSFSTRKKNFTFHSGIGLSWTFTDVHAVTTAVTSNAKLPCYVQKTFYFFPYSHLPALVLTLFQILFYNYCWALGWRGAIYMFHLGLNIFVLASSAPWIITSICVDLLGTEASLMKVQRCFYLWV